MACCSLHNFLIDHHVVPYTMDTDAYVQNGTWRAELSNTLEPLQRKQTGNNTGREPKAVQETLKEWFNTVGSVEWQEKMVTFGQGLEQQVFSIILIHLLDGVAALVIM